MVPRACGDYRLTAKQAEALALADQGLMQGEIARRLGVAPDTIGKRLRRARLLRESQRIADQFQRQEGR